MITIATFIYLSLIVLPLGYILMTEKELKDKAIVVGIPLTVINILLWISAAMPHEVITELLYSSLTYLLGKIGFAILLIISTIVNIYIVTPNKSKEYIKLIKIGMSEVSNYIKDFYEARRAKTPPPTPKPTKKEEKPKVYPTPPIPKEVLKPYPDSEILEPYKETKFNKKIMIQKGYDLLNKLKEFQIEGEITRTYVGAVVTTYEIKLAPGIKVSKFNGLQEDIAMAMGVKTVRIQAPIPGKTVVGVEVPNKEIATIPIRKLIESDEYQSNKAKLKMIIGETVNGKTKVIDLAKQPHLLVAGTTGSGKSVGINAMLISLLMNNTPEEMQLLLIDPKQLEFTSYKQLPHLLREVITEPNEAIEALKEITEEMQRRYTLLAKSQVKNIENYNKKKKDKLPYLVVIIDELADLMMTGGKEVEHYITRIAQMARASGIHLIVATQRPSVDVITGLIKANLPARLSYRVGTKTDSKVVLDATGAETLIGKGDALYLNPNESELERIHAPWNTEEDIKKIVQFYNESTTKTCSKDLQDKVKIAKEYETKQGEISINKIQTICKVGYAKAKQIKAILDRENEK